MTSTADATFDQIIRAEEQTPLKVMIAGQEFTVVDEPKAGAMLILARRLDDKNPMVQMSAAVRLMEKWIIPADHDRLFSAIEDVENVARFLQTEFAKFIEDVSARPTWAPAS